MPRSFMGVWVITSRRSHRIQRSLLSLPVTPRISSCWDRLVLSARHEDPRKLDAIAMMIPWISFLLLEVFIDGLQWIIANG